VKIAQIARHDTRKAHQRRNSPWNISRCWRHCSCIGSRFEFHDVFKKPMQDTV